MTKKKWLKQDLEYAENRLKATQEAFSALSAEVLELRAEKQTREISDRLAKAIGTGSFYAHNYTVSVGSFGHMTASVDISGDPDTVYRFVQELAKGF